MKTKTPLTLDVKTEIPWSRIRDLLTAAFEGGISYWVADSYDVLPDSKKPDGTKWEATDFYDAYGIARYKLMTCGIGNMRLGGVMLIVDDEDPDKAGNEYKIDTDMIEIGLKVMATKYQKHFADFLNYNEDAITGDVFVQCCCFKEVIYG